MANNVLSAAERQWRAESDARTLSEALQIQKDSKRMEAAKKAARNMIEATQKKYSFATGGSMKSTRAAKKK